MLSWHDYQLTGYSVDGASHRITFDVSWPYGTNKDIPRALVVFVGVEGYFFEHDPGGNIIYAIEDVPLQHFLVEQAAHFEREKKWGWPLFWRGDVAKASVYLHLRGIKCFEISSSYGLSGWVLATRVEYQERA